MEPVSGERALWRAVICTAIDDASGLVCGVRPLRPLRRKGAADRLDANPAFEAERRRAKAWLEQAGADFREVCALAGVSAEAVRAAALERIAAVEAGRLPEARPLMAALADEHNARLAA